MERKYEQPSQFQPNSLVIFTSNYLWEVTDSTTGLQRRIIYIKIPNKPTEFTPNFFARGRPGESGTPGGRVKFYYR